MPLHQVTIESANKLGSLPGYVSDVTGEHKKGVIVIQEVKLICRIALKKCHKFFMIFCS
jgi:hypothetical protein